MVATGMRAPAIEVSDNVAWPYRIQRLQVTIDGAPAAMLVSDVETSHVRNLPVEAGQHTVILSAVIGVDGSDCELQIDTSRAFSAVEGSHPTIHIDLDAQGAASSFEVRARATLSVTEATFVDVGSGGRMVPLPGASPDAVAKRICRDTPDYVELVKASDLAPSPGLSARGLQ